VDVRVYVSSVEGILTPISTPTFTYYNAWTPAVQWMHSSTWGTASSPLLVRSANVQLSSFDVLFDGLYRGDFGTNGDLNDDNLPGTFSSMLLHYRPPTDMSAGFYNFSLVVQDDFTHGSASTGTALMFEKDRPNNGNYYRFYFFQSSLHGVSYSICLFPSISAVTPSLGSIAGGTIVTITGTGFSPNTEDFIAFVGGLPCVVISSSWDTIQCQTSPKLTSTEIIELHDSGILTSTLQNIPLSPRDQGSPGWWFKVWDATDVWANKLEHNRINFEFGWRQKFFFSLYDFYGWDWYLSVPSSLMYPSQVYAFDAGAIFTASYAGYYTFYVAADDTTYLYASTDGMELNEKLIAYAPSYTAYNLFRFPNLQISKPIPLKKGEHLYLRYRGVNTGGYDSFVLALKIEPQYDCTGRLMEDWDPLHSYSCPSTLDPADIVSPESNFPESILQHHAVFETQQFILNYNLRRERQVSPRPRHCIAHPL
jgi:hypothetical protein